MTYRDDPIKWAKSQERYKKTMGDRYPNGEISDILSVAMSNAYAKEAERFEKIELVAKDEVFEFLKDKREYYSGKGSFRKMKRDNPEMYKSLIYYTDEFKKFNNGKSLPFLARFDICLDNFELKREKLCLCGSRIKFDPAKQTWSKLYCRKCRQSGVSKAHFKMKYGDDWEKMWKKRKINPNNGSLLTRGENETKILDKIESEKNISLDRNFRCLNYYPDGYDAKNNVIYEVYEKYHKSKSQQKKDDIRMKILQNYLKCDFVVYWDDGSNNIEYYEFCKE